MNPPAPSDSIDLLRLHEVGELVFAHDIPAGASLFECLRVAWEEARVEAHSMYEAWRGEGDREAYVVYRAAQDRADTAQDALALIARGAL